MDDRVQDYLDDKLQSVADLDSIDVLLHNVQFQQDLLRKQLQDARRSLAEVQVSAENQKDLLRSETLVFQQEQDDIDRRLFSILQSQIDDEAIHEFKVSMDKLRQLEVAAEYVELLKEVYTLRNDCLENLGQEADAALVPYQRLQQLVTALRPLQDAAEGAAPHLLDHIVATVRDLGCTIRASFSRSLEGTLKKINWPTSRDRIPLALEKEWTANIGRLLDLQRQELEDQEHGSIPGSRNEPLPLLPLQVLVHPFEQRFEYHFSGNKPTNRLDKPEYFLNHINDLIADHCDFVQDNVQHILSRHFRRSDLALTPANIDAISAFTTALLPMVKQKLKNVAGQMANQPSLLSHLVQEVIKFDNNLQDSYAYAPNSSSTTWRGMSYFLLETCNLFDKWLAAEQDFALTRYRIIIESSEAGELDFDAVGTDVTKPTKAAIRVNDLLETITERYRSLPSFSQKMRFLIGIQIEIFDQYYKRLSGGLDAYQALTSRVGRTMQGISREESVKMEGSKGLDYLCRIFGSAEYMERAMRDWSDDLFFLELWAELDYRSKTRDNISGKMDFHDVQRKTSSALGVSNDGGLEGALFDETAGSYHRLRVKGENVLIEAFSYDIRQALKSYASITTWSSLSSSSAGSSVSAELDPTLRLLSDYLGFLRKAVGRAPLRRIGRAVCHVIQSYIWDNVLQSRTSFSTAGAAQLTTDMRAVCSNVDRFIRPNWAQTAMKRLLEAVTLLGLPVRGGTRREKPGSTGAAEDEDDSAAWQETEITTGDLEEPEDGQMSLFQVERLVFQDNEGARHALEQLGLETLTETEARNVLGKRVEISS